jgi:hypothetical protein
METVAELVGSDLAITTKIIQVVNSAFMRNSGKSPTLRRRFKSSALRLSNRSCSAFKHRSPGQSQAALLLRG